MAASPDVADFLPIVRVPSWHRVRQRLLSLQATHHLCRKSMIDWHSVPQWCLGANDRFGTCFFAAFANWFITQGGAVMPDGEIENAAREMEGFNPYDASTDHGEYLDVGLRYITTNGWPGDPVLKPAGYRETSLDEALRRGAAMAWCMLPAGDEGPDFSDDAVRCGEPGSMAHAVLVVAAEDGGYWLITWARPQWVSAAWWRAYGRQAFVVEGVPVVAKN